MAIGINMRMHWCWRDEGDFRRLDGIFLGEAHPQGEGLACIERVWSSSEGDVPLGYGLHSKIEYASLSDALLLELLDLLYGHEGKRGLSRQCR
jgi:hypothetical protein